MEKPRINLLMNKQHNNPLHRLGRKKQAAWERATLNTMLHA